MATQQSGFKFRIKRDSDDSCGWGDLPLQDVFTDTASVNFTETVDPVSGQRTISAASSGVGASNTSSLTPDNNNGTATHNDGDATSQNYRIPYHQNFASVAIGEAATLLGHTFTVTDPDNCVSSHVRTSGGSQIIEEQTEWRYQTGVLVHSLINPVADFIDSDFQINVSAVVATPIPSCATHFEVQMELQHDTNGTGPFVSKSGLLVATSGGAFSGAAVQNTGIFPSRQQVVTQRSIGIMPIRWVGTTAFLDFTLTQYTSSFGNANGHDFSGSTIIVYGAVKRTLI